MDINDNKTIETSEVSDTGALQSNTGSADAEMQKIMQFLNTLKIKKTVFGGFNKLSVWELLKDLNRKYQELFDRQRSLSDDAVTAMQRRLNLVSDDNRFLSERNRQLVEISGNSDGASRYKQGGAQFQYFFQTPGDLSGYQPPVYTQVKESKDTPAENAVTNDEDITLREVASHTGQVYQPARPLEKKQYTFVNPIAAGDI